MLDKLYYPAVFSMGTKKGFDISFPDLPECQDSCDNMENGYSKAFKILGACLVDMEAAGEEIPKPSLPQDILLQEQEFVVIIEFDMLEYKKRTRSKAVKKTLSIPCWLNEEAIALGVNFSQILQDGLVRVISENGKLFEN